MRFLFAILAAAALPSAALAQATLKDAFQGAFRVGAMLNRAVFTEANARDAALVKRQFNSITAENVLKWEVVHPAPGTFAFADADRYVAFGEKNSMFVIGHTLIWHNQTPAWVFQDEKGRPLTREALIGRMREHIVTVVGRYKGRIHGWDVVNEALNDDGTMRQTPWLKIAGEDYVAKAFQFAHEADPQAELYYNDYSLANGAKRAGAVALLRKLKAQGAAVTGVGMQGHLRLDWPTLEQEDAAIAEFAKLGLKVTITELDIDVLPPASQHRGADVSLRVEMQEKLDPYRNGLPDAVQQALAKRYAGLFQMFLKHRGEITRVTFWGVTDAGSWLNAWPVQGRTSYPLLFDRRGEPKPAFHAVVQAAATRR